VSDAALPPTADRRRYLIGFALALALTVIPFAAVYWALLPAGAALAVIALAAIVQIVVQLHYFLHIDFKRTPRENLMALCFAGFLILVMVGGSLWIMFDLHYRHRLDATAALGPPVASGVYEVAVPMRIVRVTQSAATSSISPARTVTETAT
jgi:cytochrome o ubiquinol oxidase operon protein cyoD